MVTTKYNSGNFVLLLIAVVVAFGAGWLSVMTMAFGADPVHDLRTGAVMVVLWMSLMLVPTSLIMFRRPKIGAMISCGIVVLSCASLWASSAVILVLIPAAIEGLIATVIASRSE